MNQFFIAPEPFVDFLVVQTKETPIYQDEKLFHLGLNTYQLDDFSVVLTYKDWLKPNFQEHCTLFSGHGIFNGHLLMGQEQKLTNLEQAMLGDTVGIYTAFSYDQGQFKFENDLFGQGILFYYSNSHFSIVSNRVHFIVNVLHHLDIKININVDVLLRGIYFRTHIFTSYASCPAMIADGIHQVEINKLLRMTRGSLFFQDKAFFFENHPISESKYNEHLNEGVEEFKSYFHAVLSKERFTRAVVDISGGRDSRLVAAGIMNCPQYINKIQAISIATEQESDLYIGNAITDYLDLEKTHPCTFMPRLPLSLDHQMAIWQSYFMGTYYLLNGDSDAAFGLNKTDCRFTGHTSLVLRSGFTELMSLSLPLAEMSLEDFYRGLIEKFSYSKNFDMDIQQRVHQYLRKTFTELPGFTPASKLGSLYMFYASRYHGGSISTYNTWMNCVTFNPLLTKGFYRAAHCLAEDERSRGKLFFDATYKLNPGVAAYNYDKPFIYADEALEKLNQKKILIDSDYDIIGYNKRILEFKQQKSHQFITNMPSSFLENDLDARIRRDCFAAFDELRASSTELSFVLSGGFADQLNMLFDRFPKMARRYASVLWGASNVIKNC